MTNCKHLDYPQVPRALADAIIFWTNLQIKNEKPFNYSYRGYNTTDKDVISYVESEEAYISKYGVTGGVYFYHLPPPFVHKLKKHFINVPELSNFQFRVQVVIGGNHVAPHIDDRGARKEGPLYILQTGGTKVTTTWWDPIDKYKNQYIPDQLGIPYDNLVKVEEHVLQLDNWYWLKYDNIHSVEHLDGVRLALAL